MGGVSGTLRSLWTAGYRALDTVQQSEATEVRMSPDQRDEAEVGAAVHGQDECREGTMITLTR